MATIPVGLLGFGRDPWLPISGAVPLAMTSGIDREAT
jgi:hypothetical protein